MENICNICYNNKYSENLKCDKCINVICLDCCNKLNSRRTIYTENNIRIKFNCPYCRTNNEKEIESFDIKELNLIYKNNLIQYINAYNNNIEYLNEIYKLNEKNEILKNENEKLISNTNKVININQENIENFYNLLDKYKKIIKF